MAKTDPRLAELSRQGRKETLEFALEYARIAWSNAPSEAGFSYRAGCGRAIEDIKKLVERA